MTNRRHFIGQAGLLSAGLLLSQSSKAQSLKTQKAETKYKAGLQLYSLRMQIGSDVKGVLAKVAKAGYQEVETFGYSPQGKFWGLSPAEFKEVLAGNGLTCPSGHFGLDSMLGDGNYDNLKAVIEAAKVMGLEYITVPSIGERYRKSEADFSKVAKGMNEAGTICKNAGLKLAYHNHNFEWNKVGDTSFFDAMIKETDPSLVFFEMDLYWVVRAGQNPLKILSDHPGRFPMWHLKDMDKVKPTLNTEIGSGSIDFAEIFKKAEAAGLKHVFMEQENFSMDPYESITKSCNYMKTKLLS